MSPRDANKGLVLLTRTSGSFIACFKELYTVFHAKFLSYITILLHILFTKAFASMRLAKIWVIGHAHYHGRCCIYRGPFINQLPTSKLRSSCSSVLHIWGLHTGTLQNLIHHTWYIVLSVGPGTACIPGWTLLYDPPYTMYKQVYNFTHALKTIFEKRILRLTCNSKSA